MKVKHEPLTLIPPNFETPLPPLQPAVSTLSITLLSITLGVYVRSF